MTVCGSRIEVLARNEQNALKAAKAMQVLGRDRCTDVEEEGTGHDSKEVNKRQGGRCTIGRKKAMPHGSMWVVDTWMAHKAWRCSGFFAAASMLLF